jgi:hypothetical protein
VLTLVAAGAAVLEGAVVSPRIAALHEGGAARGFGEPGRQLDTLHGLAETLGKTQVIVVLAVIVLHALALAGDEATPPSTHDGLLPKAKD